MCRLNLGELGVTSRVGQGSTFWFALPFAAPEQVLTRWMTMRQGAGDALQLIAIDLEEQTPTVVADEFDHFLNCLLHQGDLLLRTATNSWLQVLAVDPNEPCAWQRRAKSEFARTNRNRPLGQLPDYRAEVCGQWNSHSAAEQLIHEFRTHLPVDETAELVPVG